MGRKPGTLGCKTCLKRRIKCDRGLPECFHCVRSGWKCDGYPPKVQFQDETVRTIESSKLQSSSPSRPNFKPNKDPKTPTLSDCLLTFGPQLETLNTDVPGDNSWNSLRRVQLSPNTIPISAARRLMSSPPLARPPSTIPGNIARRLALENLSPDVPMRLQLCLFGSYIRFIPSRIGHNKALDLAVSCLCQAHSMRLQPEPNQDIILKGNKLYGVALKTLQQSLRNPALAFEPELLCATELLATYEMIMNDDTTAYMRHVAGISKLIYARGPDRFKTEFERSLLDAMRNPIWILALITRTPCFLDEPAWRNIACCHEGNEEVSVGRAKDRFYWGINRLPGILRDLESFQKKARRAQKMTPQNDGGKEELDEMRDDILSKMKQMFDDLQNLETYFATVRPNIPSLENYSAEKRKEGKPMLVQEKDVPDFILRFVEDWTASVAILVILSLEKLLDSRFGNLQLDPGFPGGLEREKRRLRDYILANNFPDDDTLSPSSPFQHEEGQGGVGGEAQDKIGVDSKRNGEEKEMPKAHGPDFMSLGQTFTLRIVYAVLEKDDMVTRERIRRRMELIFANRWTEEAMEWINDVEFGMCL